MGMKFTKEQQFALEKEGNVLVSAGAGSGKTAVLSERVVFYIKNKGLRINEFLILTFTRLAAGEMKDRIRKLLLENKLEDADYVDISDITTFDSFCNALVKKYHSFLGLDNNFKIIDSNIVEVLKRKFIKEELDKLYLNPTRVFDDFINSYCSKNDEQLVKLILSLLKITNGEIDGDYYLETYIDNYFDKNKLLNYFNEFGEYLLSLRDKMLEILDVIPEIYDKSKKMTFNALYREAFEELINAKNYNSVIRAFRNFKAPMFKPSYKQELSLEEIEEIEYYKSQNSSVITKYKNLPLIEEELEKIELTKPIVEMIVSICKKVNNRISAYKKKKNAYEFIDISRFAIKLVKENRVIREELKNKYKMIMIDEYQDTNDIQEEFISYIQNNNVYCVGDIKQSIYAFRNAKCEIFQNKYRLYKDNPSLGTTIDLNKNFRSRQEVLEDINILFSKIMSIPYGGANYKKEHIIEYGNKSYLDEIDPNNNNHCEIFFENDKNDIELIAKDIIEKINNKYQVCQPIKDGKWKLRDVTFKDFAIIIDRGTKFDEVIRTLSKYKIPLYVERNENVTNNPLIEILRNFAILISYLRNNKEIDVKFKHAYVSIVRSFVCMYDDSKIYNLCKENLFTKDLLYIKLCDLVNSYVDYDDYNLFFKIIEEMDIYFKLSRLGDITSNEMYLDFFLESFKQMIDLEMNLDDFINYLEDIDEYDLELNLTDQGTSDNVVRLINIHKSKGLEFNICYFPNLSTSFFPKKGFPKLDFNKKYGFHTPELTLLYECAKKEYVQETISERVRLFYVALTRAREKFYLFYTSPKNENYEFNIESVKSFNEFAHIMLNKFITNEVDVLNLTIPELNNIIDNSFVRFNVDEVEYDFEVEQIKDRASKELKLGVSKDALEFGNKIHFALEVIDFKNPNYEIIKDQFIKNKVYKFINSELLKNVKEAKVFKEYEFIDSINMTKGIIDLFLVYEDKVVIIDYKTKNIDDESYINQLKVYKDYLESKYKLNIEAYLYSLIDSKYNRIF